MTTTGLVKAKIMTIIPMKYPMVRGSSTLQLSYMTKVSLGLSPVSASSESRHVISTRCLVLPQLA